MPLDDRDYIRGSHPPYCTCHECTQRRLKAIEARNRSEPTRIQPRRKYRNRRPIFKLVVLAVIVISLVCAFAGIEPLSSYKDRVFHSFASFIEDWQAARETEQVTRIAEIERETFRLVNIERQEQGFVSPTEWDDELYRLSKSHTEKMAVSGEIFHSPESATYAENVWGGSGYYHYEVEEIAEVIVKSWMSSPLHRAWLLHGSLKHSVISVAINPNGQYASWTFWKDEIEVGPELITIITEEWIAETGKSIPWIEWLYMKGYLK